MWHRGSTVWPWLGAIFPLAFWVQCCVVDTAPRVVRTMGGMDVVAGEAAPVVVPSGGSGAPQEVQLRAGLEGAAVLRGSSGQTFMVIDLSAAQAAPVLGVRPGVAVALVIDRSGSMAGDKIASARAAALSFIDGLADGDVAAVFAYDDVVEQLAPPTVIGPTTRPWLATAIQGLRPRHSTNLHGGLVAGIQALSGAAAGRPVRRVILISDGQANVGPSSPFELGQVAASATAAGISTTAIGVGLDYNEAVLDAVAMRSGGRFYHLTEAAELAMILQAELGTLEATVARGVVIELVPAPGVEVLGATGAELTRQGSVIQLGVGDLSRQQARQIILPLRVPTDGPSQLEAAAVNLRYRAAGTDEVRAWSTRVDYGLAAVQAEVDRGVRPEIAAAVEQYRASQAQLEAARLVGEGQNERAATLLEAQAAASERRAAAWSGTAAARVRLNTAQLRSRGQVVRTAGRGAASRVQQLGLNQEAMQNQGYR